MVTICRASSCNRELTELGTQINAGFLLVTMKVGLAGAEIEDGLSSEPISNAASKVNYKESLALVVNMLVSKED